MEIPIAKNLELSESDILGAFFAVRLTFYNA
jgi:hypothetical protein